MKARTSNLSIVIPLHNEADCIGDLLTEVSEVFAGDENYEVICIDDGSTDGTIEILRSMRPKLPPLRIARHSTRCGQSAALWTGISRARAPWVATMDGDGQNVPGDIPRLLAARDGAATANLRLVAGLRRRRKDNLLKRFSSRLANAARSRLLDDGVSDTGCGLKLIHRATFLELPRFDHMHRFLPALVQRAGGEVLTVDVGHRQRPAGRSKYGLHNRLWTGIVDLLGVMWLKRRTKHPIVEEEPGHDG